MPTKNALSCPFGFRQSAIIPAGVAHCAEVDDVGGVVDEVGVEDVVGDEVEVVVEDVVVVEDEVVVEEVVVVVEEVVVEEVVVVDGATTASVKAWVALPASFAAFRANLIVPGFWGEPTSTGTPLLVLT